MTYLRQRILVMAAGAALLLSNQSLVAAPDTVQAFFGHRDLTSASLSPNGEQVATISRRDGIQRLSVTNISTGVTQTLLDLAEYSEDEAIASRLAWIDDTQLAVQYTEIREGIARLVDSRQLSFLLIAQLPSSPTAAVRLLRVRTKGRLVNPLPAEPSAFLYAKSGSVSHVYKIDTNKLSETDARLGKLDKVDGGQFIAANRIASVKGYAMRWFLDGAGTPKAVLTISTERKIELSENNGDSQFSVIEEWSIEDDDDEPQERLIPIFMAAGKNTYYCVRLDNDKRNAVFEVDFASNVQTLIYENDNHEIRGPILSDTEDDMIGVQVLRDGGLQNVYFGNSGSTVQKDGVASTIDVAVGRSLTATKELRYREAHAQPGHYLVRDIQTSSETVVGSAFPHLLDQLDSHLIDGRVTVEGLEIAYLLTVPGGTYKYPHPLVVMPHGGPIGVFDNRYFDLSTQFLAARGYAVLRVNYRGSSGYSAALREAGNKQWGKLMLEDIYAASVAVTARTDIDGSRVCAFGSSYGGYAALMLIIKYPDTYHCASSFAGVTDINLYVETPYASASQRTWLQESVGDPRTEYDELKAQSPVYVADQLQRPVQISHGEKDRVVDVEHAHRLHLALNKFDKAHDLKIYEDQGHGFSDVEQRQDLFTRLTDFLHDHIGAATADGRQ